MGPRRWGHATCRWWRLPSAARDKCPRRCRTGHKRREWSPKEHLLIPPWDPGGEFRQLAAACAYPVAFRSSWVVQLGRGRCCRGGQWVILALDVAGFAPGFGQLAEGVVGFGAEFGEPSKSAACQKASGSFGLGAVVRKSSVLMRISSQLASDMPSRISATARGDPVAPARTVGCRTGCP